MARAKDVTEAAYNQFATYDRNVWESDGIAPFKEIYVERTPTTAGAPPSTEIKNALLNSRAPVKIFLTGQRGSGKSMELRRVHEDTAIADRFEHVAFVASDWLAPHSTMPELLLALAAALAQHAAAKGYDKDWKGWEKTIGAAVAKWADILPAIVQPEAPGFVGNFKVAVKTPIMELSARIRDDVELRERVLKQDSFSVTTLARLVADLIDPIGYYAHKDVLLTIDDTDKLAAPKVARDIFLRHVDVFVRLPCRAIVTFPFWLHFEKEWNLIAMQHQVVVLQNIKVLERRDRAAVLPAAYGFFRLVYSKLVDASADLAGEEVLKEAIRLSAGIPREFLRVLQKTFELASLRGLPSGTRDLLRLATIELRRQMIYSTQDDAVRKQLMAVRRSQRLVDAADWDLLSSLLVVELTNETPWYTVHPLLDPEVEKWEEEENRRKTES